MIIPDVLPASLMVLSSTNLQHSTQYSRPDLMVVVVRINSCSLKYQLDVAEVRKLKMLCYLVLVDSHN